MSSPKLVKSTPSGILPIHGPISGTDKLVNNTISISVDAESPKNTNSLLMVPIGGLQLYKFVRFLVKDSQKSENNAVCKFVGSRIKRKTFIFCEIKEFLPQHFQLFFDYANIPSLSTGIGPS